MALIEGSLDLEAELIFYKKVAQAVRLFYV